MLYKSWPIKALLSLLEKGELPSVSVKVSKKEHSFYILWHTQAMITFEYKLGSTEVGQNRGCSTSLRLVMGFSKDNLGGNHWF